MNNNGESKCCSLSPKCVAWVIGVLGTMLLMVLLNRSMLHYTQPAPVGQGRVQERAKNLKEIQANAHAVLEANVEADKDHGIWHVPVSRGMELVEREWQNPQAGRKLLLERVAKATAPVAPKKSEFE